MLPYLPSLQSCSSNAKPMNQMPVGEQIGKCHDRIMEPKLATHRGRSMPLSSSDVLKAFLVSHCDDISNLLRRCRFE